MFWKETIKVISPGKKNKPSLFFDNLEGDWILKLISLENSKLQVMHENYTYFITSCKSSDQLSDVKKNLSHYE